VTNRPKCDQLMIACADIYPPDAFLQIYFPIMQVLDTCFTFHKFGLSLKVHKIENFFGSDFEFCTISLLVMFKY
jgi:hypothetical protein